MMYLDSDSNVVDSAKCSNFLGWKCNKDCWVKVQCFYSWGHWYIGSLGMQARECCKMESYVLCLYAI